jgi:two-component system sensor histidine kinase UhpB
MKGDLEQELAKLKHGDHICSIYENPAEQMSVAVPFIRDGLVRGERCLYIADDRTIEEVVEALEAAGVDVARERQRGALRLVTSRETYLRAGEFASQAMVDLLGQAETEALMDGFSGIRLAGEMTWAFGAEDGCGRLIEYEALLNRLPNFGKSVILCQYHHMRFVVPCIHDIIRTHPMVFLGDQVCPNPYYESSEIVLREDQPEMTAEFRAERVDWWIAQLKRARTAEQGRESALEELKQTERRFDEAAQVAHIGNWERDLRTNEITWSAELYRLFGLRPYEVKVSYQQFLNLVVPQDADRVRARADEAIRECRPFSCDYRITLPDGGVRLLQDRGGVILNEAGEPIRLVGTAQDVTELRGAERALQEYAAQHQTLTRRVLEVQEEERRHLARELHDEIGQILGAINVILQGVKNACPAVVWPRIDTCLDIVGQAIQQVRDFALDLRPSMLDDLGLAAALRWLIDQQVRPAGLAAHFAAQSSEIPLPPDLAIACFRIVQEALTNVVRHARSRQVWVELGQDKAEVHLAIRDDGVGFDPTEAGRRAARGESLGLLGIRERAEILGGRAVIESEPGHGTRVLVWLPLTPTPGAGPGEGTS